MHKKNWNARLRGHERREFVPLPPALIFPKTENLI